MLDFYTVTTGVDMTEITAFDSVVQAIGLITQPLIIGEPYEQNGEFMLRVAVRSSTLSGREDQVTAALQFNDPRFTSENTQVVRASRL